MYETRLVRVFTLFAGCLGALALHAFRLQVVDGDRLVHDHESRVHGRFVVAPRRGEILWADGTPIASNEPGFSVVIDADAFFATRWRCAVCGAVTRRNSQPAACPECGGERCLEPAPPPDPAALAHLFGVGDAAIEKALVDADASRRLHPEYGRHELLADVDRDTAVAVALAGDEFPGVTVKAKARRTTDPAARRVAGVAGQPTPQDVKRLTDAGRASLGERVHSAPEVYAMRFGRSGLEAAFDDRLRGEPGVSARTPHKDGRARPPVVVVPVADGAALATTLRRDVQVLAEQAVADAPGSAAAVVVDLSDGAVVALSAKSKDGHHHAVTAIRPGSVFKLVTSLALLESGVSPDETVRCAGTNPPGGRYKCDENHGDLAFRDAFAESCNTYFEKMAERVGTDAMLRAYRELGLDDSPTLHLKGSPSGLDPRWGPGSRWCAADLAKVAIGQGKALVSPLQVAIAYARVATGGRRLVPYVVADEAPAAAGVDPSIALFAPLLCEAARRTVTSGTGSGVRELGDVEAAGKSGTGDLVGGGARFNNAWFVAFAPASAPRYVAVVVHEGVAGHGADTAARPAALLLAEALR